MTSCRSPHYKEAEVRREFIDPFFGSLPWDVQNRRKYAENYKGVVHEPSLENESGSSAPDYSFQPGGRLKFYVEAKKPAVILDRDAGPAHQLWMYGWTKQLPTVARVVYLSLREYLDRWDELSAPFSPDTVFKGSFDGFVETRPFVESGQRSPTEVRGAYNVFDYETQEAAIFSPVEQIPLSEFLRMAQ